MGGRGTHDGEEKVSEEGKEKRKKYGTGHRLLCSMWSPSSPPSSFLAKGKLSEAKTNAMPILKQLNDKQFTTNHSFLH